jgi:6-phosphogluconate dehydrogenase
MVDEEEEFLMLGDIGVLGFRVMGENLAMNMESKGYTVAIHNRTVSVITAFMEGRGKGRNFIPALSIEEFVNALAKPRKIMLMIKAGETVDSTIEQLIPYVDEGDIIIDGGNSNFEDSERRYRYLYDKGIYFVGSGVSGGELGALRGPAIMPGGAKEAWDSLKEIFEAISAKVGHEEEPCTTWIGPGGAGHYVKTIHNGIEYGDMQLISEVYAIMRDVLKLEPARMAEIFKEWNQGVLESYLVEITGDILATVDDSGEPLVDKILDTAMQKGTGKWAVISALEEGEPLSLITEAVYARVLSSLKDQRVAAAKLVPKLEKTHGDVEEIIRYLRSALYSAKIISYAQGFSLMGAASEHYEWELKLGEIAAIWRGGCIIRSAFLNDIRRAYGENPGLLNLMVDDFFNGELKRAVEGLRETIILGVKNGISLPAMSSALSYYDGYHTERLPANLLQAQRDYFGAHMFERLDKPRGVFFHYDWSGEGGDTHSSVYSV